MYIKRFVHENKNYTSSYFSIILHLRSSGQIISFHRHLAYKNKIKMCFRASAIMPHEGRHFGSRLEQACIR